jgi:hypothetical protein
MTPIFCKDCGCDILADAIGLCCREEFKAGLRALFLQGLNLREIGSGGFVTGFEAYGFSLFPVGKAAR